MRKFAGILSMVLAALVLGAVELPNVFSDHAVLQRNRPIPVFGKSKRGEKITVTMNGATVTGRGDREGNFYVELPAMEAGGPYELTVNEKVFSDVMVGEVWLCSGQSNMWWTVELNTDGASVLTDCADNAIRLLNVPQRMSAVPEFNVNASWRLCAPETLKGFSAVSYFFGRRIQKELGVTVGLIDASWSATRIEPWIGPAAFLSSTDARWQAKRELLRARVPGSEYADELLKAYQSEHRKWETAARNAVKDKSQIPLPPEYPWQLGQKIGLGDPSVIWNGMIAPLSPYSLAGVIWYQGEANLWDSAVYGDLMKLWVDSWRECFHNPDMPFYFVQLAPHNNQAEYDVLPKMWECQQNFADKEPGVHMAAINDTHSVDNIHPPDKRPAGQRLAGKALAYTYGKDVGNVEEPRLAQMTVADGKLVLTFSNCKQLKSIDGTAAFELADAAGGWHAATAAVTGNQVALSAPGVAKPCAVRYGWHKTATASLAGAENGLPLATFRSGDIPERGMADELVPQLSDYKLLYRIQPLDGVMSGDNRSCKYAAEHRFNDKIRRVAIFAQLIGNDGTSKFVCVESDPWSDDPAKLGLPTAASGAFCTDTLKNAKVTTNVEGVASGFFPDALAVEMFPSNYTTPNARGVAGASDKTYDFGDSPADGAGVSGYGSFQIHNVPAKQTVFAFNAWQNGAKCDLGIGNRSDGNPDWTLSGSGKDYKSAYLLIFVK
ncbi:MAG: sialate O-acetylesterase [Victivallaceae bacterium]|nr:sialate O-acetylesterase [Victivallaceae bacterium]